MNILFKNVSSTVFNKMYAFNLLNNSRLFWILSCIGVEDDDEVKQSLINHIKVTPHTDMWHMTSPDNHRLDRQNLNKQTNEDAKQDTPEHNEIIRHEGKLGQGTHEGRKQAKSPLKLRQTEHNWQI